MLTDRARHARIRSGLALVRERLGGPGASRRAAEAILGVVRGKRVAGQTARSGFAHDARASVRCPPVRRWVTSDVQDSHSVLPDGVRAVFAARGRHGPGARRPRRARPRCRRHRPRPRGGDRDAMERRPPGDRNSRDHRCRGVAQGSLGRTVQFVVPGGTLGRYRSLFVGAPQFAVEERVVVFLGWRGPSYPYLLGLGQGVFRVAADANRSGALVTPPPMIAPAAGSARIVRGDVSRVPMPLAEFEQRVRALAGGQR